MRNADQPCALQRSGENRKAERAGKTSVKWRRMDSGSNSIILGISIRVGRVFACLRGESSKIMKTPLSRRSCNVVCSSHLHVVPRPCEIP